MITPYAEPEMPTKSKPILPGLKLKDLLKWRDSVVIDVLEVIQLLDRWNNRAEVTTIEWVWQPRSSVNVDQQWSDGLRGV